MTDSEERVEFPSGLGLTFEEAIADESNVLEKIRCSREVLEFKQSLASQSSTLESLVAHHLGLRSGICKIEDCGKWMMGGFNVVIPVTTGGNTRVVIRCPLPPKIAEDRNPGSIDEKLACEAATYIWMQENCSSIRIPFLHGFGFRDGRHVCANLLCSPSRPSFETTPLAL